MMDDPQSQAHDNLPAPISRRAALHGLALGMGLFASTSARAAGDKSTGVQDSPFIVQTQIATSIVVSLRAVGLMQVDMGLLVRDGARRTRVIAQQPLLRSAWRRTIQEFTNSYLIPRRVPDTILLGQRLQAATDQVIGPNIGRVILVSVLVR